MPYDPTAADTEQKRAVRRLITQVYVANDVAVIEELIHPRMRNHTLEVTDDGVAQFTAVMRWVHAAFGDLTWTVDDLVEDGDRVVYRGTMTGTHRAPMLGVAATGRRVSEEHIEIFRFQDGKIIERWAQRDQLGMLVQLQAAARPSAATRP